MPCPLNIHDFLYAIASSALTIAALLGTLVAILSVFPYERISEYAAILSDRLCDMYDLSLPRSNEQEHWNSQENLKRAIISYKSVYIKNQKLLQRIHLVKKYLARLIKTVWFFLLFAMMLFGVSILIELFYGTSVFFKIITLYLIFMWTIYFIVRLVFFDTLIDIIISPINQLAYPSSDDILLRNFKCKWNEVDTGLYNYRTVVPENLPQWIFSKRIYFHQFSTKQINNKYSCIIQLNFDKQEYQDKNSILVFNLPFEYWENETLCFEIIGKGGDDLRKEESFEIKSCEKMNIEMENGDYRIPLVAKFEIQFIAFIVFFYKEESNVRYTFKLKFSELYTCVGFSTFFGAGNMSLPKDKLFLSKE